MLGEPGVDPLRVGLEVLLGVGVEKGVELLLGHLAPAHGADHGIGVDLAVAEHLGEPARGDVPPDVHLPEPVLGLDVALGAEEVLGAVAVELGDAVGVPLHVDRRAQARHLDAAVDLREGRADCGHPPVAAVAGAGHQQYDQHDHDQTGAPELFRAGHLGPCGPHWGAGGHVKGTGP